MPSYYDSSFKIDLAVDEKLLGASEPCAYTCSRVSFSPNVYYPKETTDDRRYKTPVRCLLSHFSLSPFTIASRFAALCVAVTAHISLHADFSLNALNLFFGKGRLDLYFVLLPFLFDSLSILFVITVHILIPKFLGFVV